MSYFIGLLAVLGIAFSLCYFTGKRFELLFPLTNLLVIAVLYTFGLMGILYCGGILLLITAAALLCAVAVLSVKRRSTSFLEIFKEPSVIIFLTFAAFQYVALFFMRVVGWDELTQWGLVVKNMFYSRDFGGGAAATTMFKGYPVGTSLYLYFFEMFGELFRPAYLFMAMNLMNIGFLLPVIARCKGLRQKTLGTLLILACALAFNVKMYFSIWNDMLLSVLFGYILISYFCFDKGRISLMQILSVSLGAFALTASKSTGLAFVLFAFVLIAVDVLLRMKREKKTVLRGIVFLSVFLFAVLLSKFSWNLYLNANGLGEAWDTNRLTLSGIWEYLTHPNAFQRTVTGNFWLEFLLPFRSRSNDVAAPIPYLIDLLLFGLLLRLLYRRTGEKRRIVALGIGIYATFFVYVLSMLVSFLFTFSTEEALLLTSYVRYLNTFVVAIFLLLISMWIASWRQTEEEETSQSLLRGIVGGIVAISVIVCMILGPLMDKIMQPYEVFSETVECLDEGESIYAVSIGHDGYLKDYLHFRFLATPLDCSGLKVGGSPYIGDTWSYTMTAEDTQNAIRDGGYTIVYIHRFDNAFLSQCGSLFADPVEEYTFYRFNADEKLVACDPRYENH